MLLTIVLDAVDLLAQRWPDLTVAVLFLGVIVVLVWRMSKFYYTRIKTVEDRTKFANCPANTEKINNSELLMRDLYDSITVIKTILMSSENINTEALSAKFSPRRLTGLGERLLLESQGMDFINENRDELIGKIEAAQPKTAYDVERTALSVLLMITESSEFNRIKDYVYRAPAIKFDDGNTFQVRLADVCFVMSLPLRDEYLTIHPEIDPSDYSNQDEK